MNSLLTSNGTVHGKTIIATPILIINILLQRRKIMTLQFSQSKFIIHNVIQQESNDHRAQHPVKTGG